MLTIALMFILAIAFYTGARRGLVLQVVLTLGYLITLVEAKKYYLILAKKIELLIPYPSPTADSRLVFFKGETLFKLDEAFYAGIAFLMILFVGWLVTRFIGILCHKLTFFPLIKELNLLGGGILGFAVVYVGIFFLLIVLTMVPLDPIQNLFRESGFARFIVEKTPYFSTKAVEWLVAAVSNS